MRTAASIVASGLWDDRVPVVQPQAYGKIAPHVREQILVQPSSGTVIPGTTVIFKVRKSGGDAVDRVSFVGTLRELQSMLPGGATFIRYQDRAPLCIIKEARWKYNSQLLQLQRRDEIIQYCETMFQDEEQANSDYNQLGNLTDSQRNAASANPQAFKVTLYNSFLQHDVANSFFCEGMASELELELDLDTMANVVQCDGTPTLTADSIGNWISSSGLQIEYFHITEGARSDMTAYLANPNGLRYFHTPSQIYSDRILGTSPLDGTTQSIMIRGGITKPIAYLCVLLRWVNDLTRTVGGANGDRGRDYTNFGGWYSPGGANSKISRIFTRFNIKSGNNTVVDDLPIDEYIYDYRSRHFKGTPGVAILWLPWATMPTLTNAHTGSVSFDLLESPTANFVTAAAPKNGSGVAMNTVNDCATADIGGNSDLQVDFLGIANDFIDITNHDASKPFG